MLILVGVAYQVDDDVENAKDAVLEALSKFLPKSEAMIPVKVWGSDEPDNAARCAELNYLNFKAQTHPDFGWTVAGKELQEAALREAAAESAEKIAEEVAEQAEQN